MTFYSMDIHLIVILLLAGVITLAVLLSVMMRYVKEEQVDDRRSNVRAKRIVAVAYGNKSGE